MNVSKVCVRALSLLALALFPPVTCMSLPSIRSMPPRGDFVPKCREELDMQWQLVPKSLEDLDPGKALSHSGLPFLRPSEPAGWESAKVCALHQQRGLSGQLPG